jgi:hypothetical protein
VGVVNDTAEMLVSGVNHWWAVSVTPPIKRLFQMSCQNLNYANVVKKFIGK